MCCRACHWRSSMDSATLWGWLWKTGTKMWWALQLRISLKNRLPLRSQKTSHLQMLTCSPWATRWA